MKFQILLVNIFLLFIINKIKGDVIKADSPYCTQYNDTAIYFDINKLDNLSKSQYINKEFKDFRLSIQLDYYIRYLLISKGYCYYDSPDQIKSLSEIKEYINSKNERKQIRYEKTVNCYYMYQQYTNDTAVLPFICQRHCYSYLMSIMDYVLECPYPQNTNMVRSKPTDEEIYNYKYSYLLEIQTLCQSLEGVDSTYPECENSDNIEMVNCGFPDAEMKAEYCKNSNDSCCKLRSKNQSNVIEYDINLNSIIGGIATSAVFLVTGIFFSFRFIKDIKIQERIKQSVQNQEMSYEKNNNANLQDAYNKGYDPNKIVYNSNSRNLNSDFTLKNVNKSPAGGITNTIRSNGNSFNMSVATPSGSGSNTLYSNHSGNSNNRMGGGSTGVPTPPMSAARKTPQYPPNCYTVQQDNPSSDSRDITLKRGMIVQLIQRFDGGWVMVMDINSKRQGYAPENCLGRKLS